MTSPYEMFAPKKALKASEPVTLDYGSFKIFAKYGGANNRSFINAYNLKMRIFSRREALADSGKLSEDAVETLEKQKTHAMAELYADHILVGWESVKDAKGKKMEYSRENVIKLLTDLDPLFADIIAQCAEEANFAAQEKEDEEKNLPASSNGGGDTVPSSKK